MNQFLHFDHLRNKKALLLLICALLLSHTGLYAQENILKRRITLEFKQVAIGDALLQIADAAGVHFSYGNDQIDSRRIVTLSIQQKTIEETLNLLFPGQLEKVQVKGTQVTLRTKAPQEYTQFRVLQDTGEPLPFATIAVDGVSVAQSDKGGLLRHKMSIGKHKVTVSSLGFQQQTREVHLQEGGSKVFTFNMLTDNNHLQTIEVVGRKETSYRNSNTFSGTKTDMSWKEVPQAISYVTKETIDDQLVFKVNEAIKNVSGVSQSTSNNRSYVIRGFEATSKLINGQRVVTEIRSQTMLPNIERVEVLKGPTSALYANADPGGTINLVTKKPLAEARKSVQFATGSYNTNRLSADFTGPMNADKTLLYRLNLAYQDSESFRALQGGKYTVIAPSFSFLPSERTRVNVEFLYQMNNTKFDRGQPIFGANTQEDLYTTPTSFAIGKRNDFAKELFMNANISLQHKFSEQVTFNTAFTRSMYDEDLIEHRTANGYGVDSAGNELPDMIAMQAYQRQAKNNMDNLSAYFNIKLTSGPLQHTVLLGYDYIQEIFPVYNSATRARGYLSKDRSRVYNSYDPSKSDRYLIINHMPVPNVPHFDLKNPDYGITSMNNYIVEAVAPDPRKYYLNGFYVQDQIKWGKFQVLLAIRKEYYTDIVDYGTDAPEKLTQSAFIPRVGITYTPNETVSFYGNFAEGYQPQSAAIVGDEELYGGPFDPLTSRIYEVGAKFDLFYRKLSIGTALYEITQNNILVSAFDEVNVDRRRQIGQQRARGFEMDIYGNILPNLTLTAAFSYNIAKIVESDIAAEVGAYMPNAPKGQGNIWAKYTMNRGVLQGVGFGLGANYATQRNMTNMGVIKLPSYVVLNSAVYYQVDKFKLTCTFNNMLNEVYWVAGENFTRLFPGTPSNFLVSLGYLF
ncbi:TonB-dependent siderophore receptor [Pedobacter sp. AW31-3R]|uniref:TonB-dependent siderophore receptor n=1 Tax=Pedobacter sp. AW31-3R TaxID=3445781 RepID=UPI003FA05A86